MTDSADDPWRQEVAKLHCLLGEWHLATLRIPVLSRDVRPAVGDVAVDLCSMPLPSLPHGVSTYRFPSVPVEGQLPRLSLENGRLKYVTAQYRRFFVDLRGTHAEYLQRFSSKTRSTFRRKAKRFGEYFDGHTVFRTFTTPSELREFHAIARVVSARTYQERLLHQGLPEGSEYLDDLVQRASGNRVRAYLLFGNDQPVAFLCCHVEGRVVEYTHVGYDPQLAALSPGTVLMTLVIEDLYRESAFGALDFTEGEGPHKELFANTFVPCADVLLLARLRPRVLAMVLLHWVSAATSRTLVRVVDSIGLKARLKRYLRHRQGAAGDPPGAEAE